MDERISSSANLEQLSISYYYSDQIIIMLKEGDMQYGRDKLLELLLTIDEEATLLLGGKHRYA